MHYTKELERACIHGPDVRTIDALRDAIGEWKPIDTVPKDGTHVLVAKLDGNANGFGRINGKEQPWADVAHWYDDPEGPPGLFPSWFGNGEGERITWCTHWRTI